jgi:NTP pyrophosphatase (non-canonical NTP hydrolase)
MNYETDETPSIQADHSSLVYTLVKDPVDILDSMDYEKMNLIHAILGVSGEAGELLDSIKKHCIYNKPLDVENVIEELGDLEFYLEQLRQILNISREDTLTANILKLRKRYPSGYTDKHAQQRLDKIEQK